MTPEQADEALSRELRHRARLEFQRRSLIEQAALIVERGCDRNDPDGFRKQANQARVLRLANRVRALETQAPGVAEEKK